MAVIADGGGHASLASDRAADAGLEVPAFGPELVASLRALLPPSAGVSNPVDLAGAGEQDITSFARVLDAVLADPTVDAALISGYFGGYGVYGEALAAGELATAAEMARVASASGKPVLMQTMEAGAPATRELQARGIPVFRAIEDATGALGRLAVREEARGVPGLPPAAAPVADDGYWAARELVAAGGVPLVPARLARDSVEAVAAADALGYPVAVKALGLLHKSDAGGVALGLADARAVATAVEAMATRLAPPGFSVEVMADLRGGVELIAGVRRDPRFGPVAMVGLGGIFTEVLADVAFALAPLDAASARTLLDRLGGAAMLHGARGRPPVAVDAAAAAIAALTSVAAAHPELAELEVNPLLVTPAGAVGLDARIVLG